MKIDWQGVYSALVTPFTDNDTIDVEMLKINVAAQLDAGIDGIIIGGSLGEASTLLNNEKIELLKICKEVINRPVPVIMNIAEQSTKCAIESAIAAENNGADGLMLMPPMRYYADGKETVIFFKEVAKTTSLPIIIYNNPYDYKIEVTLSMFEDLTEVASIQAVKESTRVLTNLTRMKNLFHDRFKILCGVDTLALEELALGADGWIGGLVNAFPKETVAIYRLIKAGDYVKALEIYRWFFPLLELDIHSKLVQYIKLAARQTGIGSEYVRPPRLTLVGEERISVLTTIENAIATRPILNNYQISKL